MPTLDELIDRRTELQADRSGFLQMRALLQTNASNGAGAPRVQYPKDLQTGSGSHVGDIDIALGRLDAEIARIDREIEEKDHL